MPSSAKSSPAIPRPADAAPPFALPSLLEGLDVGVVVQGPGSEILYANTLALDLLGRSQDEVLGVSAYDSSWDVLRPDGRAFTAPERPVARVLATRAPVRDEVLGVRRLNGERAWLLVNAIPHFEAPTPRGEAPAGPVAFVVVTLSDISSERRRFGLLQQVKDELEVAVAARTAELAESVRRLEEEVRERRRVEAALARSESMYRSVLRAMAEGVAIHAPDGAIEYVNPAAQRVLGLSEAQLTGRRAVDPGWELQRPDGSPLPAEEIPSEITRATGAPCERHRLQVRQGEGGARLLLEVSTEPVLGLGAAGDDPGAPPYVVTTFTDVTESHRTTAALEASRARFERVTDAVPGVLYQLRHDPGQGLTMLFASARTRELLGVEAEEVRRYRDFLANIVHPEDRASVRASFKAAAAAFERWEVDFRVRDEAGTWRWVRSRAVPEREGEATVWSGVITDVTEERSLAEQVQVAQRREAVGAVTAGIAHNFNNALAVLLPNLEELAEGGDASMALPLQESLRTARSAAALVRQLMTIARGEVGEAPTEPFDAVAVLHEVAALCRGIFRARVEFGLRVDVPAVRVQGRAAAFHQVLLNLCLNARDALHDRDGGRVELSLAVEQRERDAAVVVIRVRDNGEGMSPAQLARLGEPFFTTKAPGVGTGLGLATAYATVRDMRGQIRCRSTVGEGSEFTLEVPAISAPARSAGPLPALTKDGAGAGSEATEHAGGPPPEGPQRPWVLLVDDDELVRGAMSRMLQRRGYRVDTAAGGAEGLAQVDAAPGRYAAVVLDLSMPGLPGERVLARLTETHPALPVVVLSGFVENPRRVDAARAVLHKPVTGAQLSAVLDALFFDEEQTV